MTCKDCIHSSVCEYTHQALPLSDITYDECDHVENIGCPFINKQYVKPVIYAHWTKESDYWCVRFRCSNCNCINHDDGHFCSNCGAKMDLEE